MELHISIKAVHKLSEEEEEVEEVQLTGKSMKDIFENVDGKTEFKKDVAGAMGLKPEEIKELSIKAVEEDD